MTATLSPAADPDAALPSLAELALGEQLVVWAMRKRLESATHLPAVQRGFELTGGGPHEQDAFAAFEQLFAALARNCRRDLWFHRCGCGCVSPDEVRVLGLIAALQAGDVATAWGHGQALVVDPALGELLQAARELGQALAERRLALPLRRRLAPDRPGAGMRLH